jgi:exopolyphosphatase / guanosine-5'-triphosphate,3'-diphosphate pyrophosphatase
MPQYAAIDVGSNAIRLLIAQTDADHKLIGSVTERYALRLGGDVFSTGEIQPATIAALTTVFKDIATRIQTVQSYRAIATSAMREAKNAPAIVNYLQQQTGVQLEIISGTEEARLMREGLTRAMGGTLPTDTLLIDLGGGSLEVEQTGVTEGRSFPLGTVRLIGQYPALASILSPKQLMHYAKLIHTQVHQYIGKALQPAPLALGTSGNFEALANAVPKPYAQHLGVDLARLPEVASVLASLPVAARASRYGLKPDRADLILPAVLVTSALCELYSVQQFVVPKTGLREALIAELVRAH